jgi:hypothetical protein
MCASEIFIFAEEVPGLREISELLWGVYLESEHRKLIAREQWLNVRHLTPVKRPPAGLGSSVSIQPMCPSSKPETMK